MSWPYGVFGKHNGAPPRRRPGPKRPVALVHRWAAEPRRARRTGSCGTSLGPDVPAGGHPAEHVRLACGLAVMGTHSPARSWSSSRSTRWPCRRRGASQPRRSVL